MVKAYIVDHKAFAEDCGCTHYIAQAFDGQGDNNQLQPAAPALKLQDYMPANAWPVPAASPFAVTPLAGLAPNHYQYRVPTAVFHPPCILLSLS